MQLRDRRAVVWPSAIAWQTWWVEQVGDAERSLTERCGVLYDDDQVIAHLIEGAHLHPGARYRVDAPDLTSGEVTAEVSGIDGQRRFAVAYRDYDAAPGEPERRAWAQVCDLEHLDRADAHSSLRHLGVDAWFTTGTDQLAHLNLTLDWARLQIDITREPGDGCDLLSVRVHLQGRGVWRAALAPLLRSAKGQLERSLQVATAEAAAALTEMAREPSGVRVSGGVGSRAVRPGPVTGAAAAQSTQWAREHLNERFEAVFQRVDSRRWLRGRRTWRAAYRRVGVLDSREADAAVPQSWAAVELAIMGQIAATPHRRRAHVWTELLDEALAAQHDGSPGPVGAAAEDSGALAGGARLDPEDDIRTEGDVRQLALDDQTMDLSWLATPWSTVRWLMAFER